MQVGITDLKVCFYERKKGLTLKTEETPVEKPLDIYTFFAI
jgi:hypothetical protein